MDGDGYVGPSRGARPVAGSGQCHRVGLIAAACPLTAQDRMVTGHREQVNVNGQGE